MGGTDLLYEVKGKTSVAVIKKKKNADLSGK